MKALRFQTNIKCDGCIAKVAPNLNKTAGEDNWKVDLQNTEKILTVEGNASEEQVLKAISQSGFQAKRI